MIEEKYQITINFNSKRSVSVIKFFLENFQSKFHKNFLLHYLYQLSTIIKTLIIFLHTF